MRLISCLILATALQIPAAVFAQQITIAGWVDHVDAANSTITIRTLANPRTIAVAPSALVRINGVAARLDQLSANSDVTIIAEKDPNGVLRATQVNVTRTSRGSPAAAPPGSIIQGTLVGLNIPMNTILVRTPAGDVNVSLGTAPIIVNRVRGSSRDLRIGQSVQVERTLPTEGSTDFVTQLVRIMPPAAGGPTGMAGAAAAGGRPGPTRTGAAGPGVVDRGTLLTQTRGYRGYMAYSSHRYRSHLRGRRASRYNTRYHRRHRRASSRMHRISSHRTSRATVARMGAAGAAGTRRSGSTSGVIGSAASGRYSSGTMGTR